jgi:hypothetical protein
MKKVLVFLLLGGIGAGAFVLWRRMQQQAEPTPDLWAPVEPWPADGADRWPTAPTPSSTPADVASEPVVPKRAPRKKVDS